ncbi:hypothetical protein NliqN6_0768 [Naganishia liquefaciens]|uniref:SRP54-type proteins GTP-binding domain-containing protein n=1 Tax=Naganishia liquefaciens TaxID=104408 RepID=A0A8H3TP64_9TREE|nr:hypothetical protein NliqN6_0768 [Naganishia liquefaciens]
MLDHVSISHESGLILWSRSFNPTFLNLESTSRSPVNSLVRDVIMENKAIVSKGEEQGIDKDGFSVRWTLENGLGLVFVVVFPALLPLTYIPELLVRMKQLFISLFHPYIEAFVSSLSLSTSTAISDTLAALQLQGKSALVALQEQIDLEKWEAIFERCLKGCEERASTGHKQTGNKSTALALSRKARISAAEAIASPGVGNSSSATSDTENQGQPALSAEEIAKNVQALKGRLKTGKQGSSGRRGGTPSPASSPARSTKAGSATSKVMRKWADSTSAVSQAEMDQLDFSGPDGHVDSADASGSTTPLAGTQAVDLDSLVSTSAMGKVGNDGLYEVADWDTGRKADGSGIATEEEILAKGRQAYPALFGNSLDSKTGASATSGRSEGAQAVEPSKAGSALSNLFSRFTGSKVLTKQDLEPVLAEMEKHLMGKNVAKDIAEKICEGVGTALAGKRLGGMSSVKSQVNAALSTTITQILTSKSSTDILLDIKRKASRPQTDASTAREPYIMTFIGVNGVGKSTNLSKVCFWLLQNKLRVLIAACDTFRSGAVEQLRVHVRNLGLLGEELGRGAGQQSGLPRIELYERGYGKDAAGIAKDAIAYAKEHEFDVVLVDTAGRMQDNEPLMRALAKLVAVNNPDKVIFVGEALVGNEAVDQLSKFDRSLKDFTSSTSSGPGIKGKARGIDGMILTKFDTIDDKVGAALSMTYITGQPILFVGCGQTYTDLRHLKVDHIVQALLSE